MTEPVSPSASSLTGDGWPFYILFLLLGFLLSLSLFLALATCYVIWFLDTYTIFKKGHLQKTNILEKIGRLRQHIQPRQHGWSDETSFILVGGRRTPWERQRTETLTFTLWTGLASLLWRVNNRELGQMVNSPLNSTAWRQCYVEFENEQTCDQITIDVLNLFLYIRQ